MLTLFGSSKSRAARSILALEEMGLGYHHVAWGKALRDASSEERKSLNDLNPNGHIPVLRDGDVVIWESLAINLYLAEKFQSDLWPADAVARGYIYQWSFWVQTEIDRRDWQAARRSNDDERIRMATEEKITALGILNEALVGNQYLLGDVFTLADLNVASAISQPNEEGKIDWQRLDPFDLNLPELGAWLSRCTNRESWLKVRKFED